MDTEHNWNEKCLIHGAMVIPVSPGVAAGADSGLPGMLQCYCFILKHQLRPISSARFLPASTGPGCLNREQPVIIIMASRENQKSISK